MPLSQKQRVENSLRRAPDGICSRFFIYDLHPGIPRIAARIADLRDEHMNIVTEKCDLHPGRDPQAYHVKYRMITDGGWF